jgi:hypothetical protein
LRLVPYKVLWTVSLAVLWGFTRSTLTVSLAVLWPKVESLAQLGIESVVKGGTTTNAEGLCCGSNGQVGTGGSLARSVLFAWLPLFGLGECTILWTNGAGVAAPTTP